MERTYLGRRRARAGLIALAPLLLAVAGVAGTAAALGPARVRAAALFDAQPVEPGRFAVLARPVGRDDWTLLVLEQLREAPLCWQMRADGLVDPSLNRFDYTGICGRYLDSNGYSLRFARGQGGGDGSDGLRLRVEPVGDELQLQAASADLAGVLVVGRAPLPQRQREAFVAIRLEPGWELQRRRYGSQALNHLYFSHPASARELLARASATPGESLSGSGRRPLRIERDAVPLLPPPPPPLGAEIPPARRPGRSRPISQARLSIPSPNASLSEAQPAWAAAGRAPNDPQLPPGGAGAMPAPGRVVALQVIPFRE